MLLATSWDQHVRLYDAGTNTLKSKVDTGSPVLDSCFSSPFQGYCCGLDGNVRAHDFNTDTMTVLGKHELATRCIEYSSANSMILTGSWDKTVTAWDPRVRGATGTYSLPDKVFTMSTAGDKLVVGTAGRHVWIYDLRNMSVVEQRRESSLKFQTRSIRMFPSGDGYVLSSIDGRVAVEWIDPSPEAQGKKYAFKCHRGKEDGQDVIYPVNSLAFHPVHGTFASGGCDGMVNIWDAKNKKRLCQTHKYPTSISAMAFSSDGTSLAIASSYTYEEGEKDHPADAIFIRRTTDVETKPK